MNMRKDKRQLTAIFISLAAVLSLSPASVFGGNDIPAIHAAPPPPVFDQKARLAELAARRARVAEKIGPNGVLILFSATPRVYANDVDYEYRQENNFYYLTNLKQRGATLVLIPGSTQRREILFLPGRNPTLETWGWSGHMYRPEDARQISGIGEIWEAKEFEPFMRALRNRQIYHPKDDAVLMSARAAPLRRAISRRSLKR